MQDSTSSIASGPETEGHDSAPAAVRCVLWRPRGSTSPEALLNALDRRSIKVRTSETPFGALAQVCRMERPASSDAAEPHVLLLDRPEQLEDVGDVVAAVSRFAPRTACWLFEPTNPPTLRAVEPDDVRSWADASDLPAEALGEAPRRARIEVKPASIGPKGDATELRAGPALRLTGAAPGSKTSSHDTEPRPETTGEVLSDEELEMLLADERTRDESD